MLKAVKIVGLNFDSEVALAHITLEQPIDGMKANLRLFGIVSCEADDAFSITRQAFFEAEGVFFGFNGSPATRLAETLQALQKSLSGTDNLQILLGATSEDESGTVLYLMQKGDILKAYLLRGKEQNDLCKMLDGQLISGVLEEGDRVVIVNPTLIGIVGEDLQIFLDTPMENLEDEIGGYLPEAEACPVAAVVLEKERIRVEEPEVLPVEEKITSRKFNIPKIPQKSMQIIGIALLILVLIVAGFVFASRRDSGKKPSSAPVQQQNTNQLAPASLYQVQDLPVWLDLGLIKDGFSASLLSLSHGNLLLLDSNQKTVVRVNLTTKANKILAGGDKIGKAKLVSLNGEVAWIYSQDFGIIKVDSSDNTVTVVEKPDDNWGVISDIYGFAGNIYLLDSLKNQIWKYVPVESGYSGLLTYFKDSVKTDLLSVKRMQIDSSVWILKGNGDISKFTQGIPDFFSVGGLDKNIKNPKSLFVSDETDNLYLLDSGNNRLLVLDKKGQYIAQYLSDKMSTFSDLVVDEKGKKVYLLDGSKIYSMDLK